MDIAANAGQPKRKPGRPRKQEVTGPPQWRNPPTTKRKSSASEPPDYIYPLPPSLIGGVADRPPGIALYIRASSDKQMLSPDAQIRATSSHIKLLGMPMIPQQYTGPAEYGLLKSSVESRPGVFIDHGASAFKMPFHQRAAGARLLQCLIPGDVVMVLRMDRLCRSMADYCSLVKLFVAGGIRLVLCSPSIDLGTANGRMAARNLVNLAEWESDRKGERIREALAQKKLRINTALEPSRVAPGGKIIPLPSEYRPQSAPELLVDNQPGRIILYNRCSHRDSADSGLGLAAQLDISRLYSATLIQANPRLQMYDTLYDIGVSAYKNDLRARPSGRLLDKLLQRGDHVVFAMLDRGFRNLRDMINTIPDWRARGVEIHFAADRLCMSDPSGELLAITMAQFAQMESQLTADRTREAKAILAANGQFGGGEAPSFWKVVRFLNYTKLVLDRTRLVEWRLLRLYLASGMKRVDAMERIEQLLATRACRPVIPCSGVGPGCKLYWQMPESTPRDSKGRIWRRWTNDVWKHAVKNYDEALAQWRIAAEKRRRDRAVDGTTPAEARTLVSREFIGELNRERKQLTSLG